MRPLKAKKGIPPPEEHTTLRSKEKHASLHTLLRDEHEEAELLLERGPDCQGS